MSAQKVADACTALGVPIERSVLAGLENRRRSIVTVAEVIALARVLDVSPLSLIFPVGSVESVEVLPGVQTDPFTAAQWFAGEKPFPGDPAPSADQHPEALSLYRAHAQAVSELTQQLRITRRLLTDTEATPGVVKAAQDSTRARAEALRAERSLIRRMGVRVPALPDSIGSLIQIDEDDDDEVYLDSSPDEESAPSPAELLRELLSTPDGPEKQRIESRLRAAEATRAYREWVGMPEGPEKQALENDVKRLLFGSGARSGN